jgi:hypothetical protein
MLTVDTYDIAANALQYPGNIQSQSADEKPWFF